ncbi:hypothetical protein SDC9_70214 [bioreactor metagenome]|uniref:Uncharacterized protein n=1 Tax=bioreactor metagenome TaxID=1076179 RepID=A0A644Y5M2_9ZZZZ
MGQTGGLLDGKRVKDGQRVADCHTVTEHRHRLVRMVFDNLQKGGNDAAADVSEALAALHLPKGRGGVKQGQPLPVLAGYLAPGFILPHSHGDFPQIAAGYKGKTLGPAYSLGRSAGTEKVAGIHGVYGYVLKAAFQSRQLAVAVFCD